jgi:cation-transporting P-type ATPase E
VLVAAFSAGLFVPAFTTYFGLTDAADPVFFTVLPALVLWFAALSAAFRFRLLDRALGLADLTDQHPPGR